MSLQQEVDAIISEENITNENLATEEPKSADDTSDNTSKDTNDSESNNDADDQSDDDKADDQSDESNDDGQAEEKSDEDDAKDSKDEEDPEEDPSPSDTVNEAKTFLDNLDINVDKVINEDGSVKPWEEVVPAGAFLASQLEPVKVVDKDGKTHEFLLLSDVEKKFPDGFEAKNNIEQMKFQNAILGNEAKFDNAVKTYNDAREQYTKETNLLVQKNNDNQRINKEYRAMADQGLVPKVEGSPDDPKFLEQPAVKELNKILEWQEAKNKELSSKGLGQINSLYVAKQMMDMETDKKSKESAAQKIDKERKEVASLSSNSNQGKDTPKTPPRNIPMSRLADEIIATEGLR